MSLPMSLRNKIDSEQHAKNDNIQMEVYLCPRKARIR